MQRFAKVCQWEFTPTRSSFHVVTETFERAMRATEASYGQSIHARTTRTSMFPVHPVAGASVPSTHNQSRAFMPAREERPCYQSTQWPEHPPHPEHSFPRDPCCCTPCPHDKNVHVASSCHSLARTMRTSVLPEHRWPEL